MKHFIAFLSLGILLSGTVDAQETDQGVVSGNISVLFQSYQEDSLIGAVVPSSKSGFNAYSNINYTQGNFSAGFRYESYLNSVLGFPGRFKGSGIGYRYARWSDPEIGVDVTVGNFYETFRTGALLRSYEERNLGLDNAMDGVRLLLSPIDGVDVKMVYGKQRLDFDSRLINSDGIVRGLDVEISLNDIIPALKDSKLRLIPGYSFVSRFQEGSNIVKDTLILELPENVAGWEYGATIHYGMWKGGIGLTKKINDPSADNGYIYKEGEALVYYLTGNIKDLTFLFQRSTTDNMSFRSDRDLLLFDAPINNIPAITKNHTYNLASTLYPYATVINGESSFRGELYYNLKRGSKLGGKYGTKMNLVFATSYSLDTTNFGREDGRPDLVYGYQRNSWGFGDSLNVQDISFEIERKFSKKFKAKAMYMNLQFNTLATPVTTDFKGIVYANIFVLETQIKTAKRQSLRTELQALFTEQDKGDWATIVAEYTWSPHWFANITDQYNFGNPDNAKRVHYIFGSAGYINGAHRLSLGYGKRREGIFCVGGVCRAVPASSGLEMTFTSSF
ncbi:MAG: hypothetical protein HOM41_07595 [Flavobacteriales bacterium]|mgnify:CR=1 FL=1|jgi:hypothetical protein|nr:hypothetical protein [Flavobacteriales bacterium]MBT6174117.1 hypothetical protein [Flavobacteriales bacterium]